MEKFDIILICFCLCCFLAVSVIIFLGCIIIKNARQRADLEWQLNFAEVQLQHLDCVQNVNPDFPVSEGQEDGESGILTGEE